MDGWQKGRPWSADRTFVWTLLKCARPTVNTKGIKTVCLDICYQIVLYCWSDNHVVLHIHVHRPDATVQQNRYDWTSTWPPPLKMYSPINCMYCYRCASSVSIVAAAYLLKMRQATYSFVRCASPPLHHFVSLRTKCQEFRIVCYALCLLYTKVLFFCLCLPHTTQLQ